MNYWQVPNVKEKKRQMKTKISEAEAIIDKVRNYYELSERAVKGPGRQKTFVKARFISMYILRATTTFTLKEIGEIFDRDHTTVIHALQVVNDVIGLHYDTDFKDDLKEIEKIFGLSTK